MALALCYFYPALQHVQAQSATEDRRSPAYLDQFVGTFEESAVQTISIRRVQRELEADAGDGRPPAILLPRREYGRFVMRDADFAFQFVADTGAAITALDIVDSRGTVRRLRPKSDRKDLQAQVSSIAVDAHTSVLARVFNGYERKRDSAGNLMTETYAFSAGGFQASSPIADSSVDGITFEALAQRLAPAMRAQNYMPARSSTTPDLVVMIYWGATTTDEHPAVIAQENYDPLNHTFRGQINRTNARLLGFEDAIETMNHVPGTKAAARREALFDDLQESRYWVALVAVDYTKVQHDREVRPVWSVRYSIRSRGTTFDEALPQMTDFASRYFGRDSDGLINPATRSPNTEVEIGEAVVVD